MAASAAVQALCAAILLASLPGAAQAMSKKECQTAKWEVLGFSDLLEGRDAAMFADRQSDCAKKKIPMDVEAYRRGAALALPVYCSTTFGLAYGSYGFAYNGMCLPEEEERYLTAYRIGAAYYPALRAAEDAESSLNASQSLLDSALDRYNRAVATMNKSDATPEEKSKAAKSAQKANQDIRSWRVQVSINEGKMTRAYSDLTVAETIRENSIYDAGLFPEGDVAQREAYTLLLDEPSEGAGVIADVEPETLTLTIAFAEPPAAAPVEKMSFLPDAAGPQEFVERRGMDRLKECRTNRKTRRALGALAKELQGAAVTALVGEVDFTPPTGTQRYSLSQVPPAGRGDMLLKDGKSPGDIFIDAGLAAPVDGAADPAWYADAECNA